jgi:DNA-binding Lrp family transcriptional regulator
MQKQLDSLDIKILEALGTYGPRNIAEVAQRINVPARTVNHRIKRLKSNFSLWFQARVYHTFIGLKKAFVFARSTSGCERLLWKAMEANDYWLFLTARYDEPESFYGIYGIPIDHTQEFEQFVNEIKALEIAQNIDLLWSTCIQTVNLTDNWYDHKSGRWIFEWDKWIEDIETQEASLPYTLLETESFPQKADWIDIVILKELQKNAACELRDIAKLLHVRPQVVQYHYRNCVIAKGLIECCSVWLPHFEAVSNNYCFRFNFNDEKNMAKFARSLMNKPFVRSMGKIYGKRALLVNIYLPREEFRGFTDTLSTLIKKGLIESYDYVIEDFSRWKAQSISYEFFKDKSWKYNHEEHIRRLREIRACRGCSMHVLRKKL